MLPDRVSNPGPLTYESGALPIAPFAARQQNWIIICRCCMRIWRAGRVGGRGFNFVRGGQNCFYLLCVCVGVRGQVQYLFFRENITDSLLLINDWSV